MGERGDRRELFIVQARPETVQSRKDLDVMEAYQVKERSAVLASGRSRCFCSHYPSQRQRLPVSRPRSMRSRKNPAWS